MKTKVILVTGLALAMITPAFAGKKKQAERGMLEKMEAVPCGAKEKGITGLGSIFGSAGIEHVNSDEKLCPQYLLRSDGMEYHIRPLDKKHPVILPVGHEGEFKIEKDHLLLKIADSADHKVRAYQVVSMKPNDTNAAVKPASVGGDHDATAQAQRVPQ